MRTPEGSGNVEPLTYDFFPATYTVDGEFRYGRQMDFTVMGLDKHMAKNPNSFFFDPEASRILNLGDYLLRSTQFIEREDWRAGREDSNQGVYFGELNLIVDDDTEHTIPIACKPYNVLARARAVHEYVALSLFKQNSNIKSYEPLGFWIDDKGAAILLTYFEEHVKSLDNIDWSKINQVPVLEGFDLFEALQISARTLARLHALGFAHRDAQIKNMAVDEITGGVRLVDLTTVRQVYSMDFPEESYDWRRAVYADLHRLVQTIIERGYLPGDDLKSTKELIDDALLSVHAGYLKHPANRARLPEDSVEMIADIDSDILASVA